MNINKIMQCTLLSILIIQVLTAQNNTTIKGTLKNKENLNIVGATVILTKVLNSSIVKASISDKAGNFEFENIKNDTLIATISYVGYATYTTPIIMVSEASSLINIGEIILTPIAKTMEAATVVAQKLFVTQKIDRTIIRPDALISNAGVSVLDVLEKAPGIMVDMNGIISLKGKSGVMIFIDDKATYLAAADLSAYLKSLPAGSVENIEIIPNPPAKYDAAGNAGIINIRLKKNIAKGFNGGINIGYGQGTYSRTNNSTNFNYRINKINFFSNFSINQNKSYQDLTIERNYFSANGAPTSKFTQNSLLIPTANALNAKMGVDCYINKKTTLGLVLSAFKNQTKRTVNNNASIKDGNNTLINLVEATNPLQSVLKNGSINVNMQHKIDTKGKEITANIDHIEYRSKINQLLTNRLLQTNGQVISNTVLASYLPSNIAIQTAKVDYTQPIKKGGIFEAGLKTSFVKTINIADFNDIVNTVSTPNYDFSNNFKYNENIHAAYLNYNRDFKHISLQLGFRVENTNIKGYQLGNPVVKDSSFKRSYTNTFPTLFLQYKADSVDKNVFGISLGRRIDRPNYKDLNPFSYPLDRYTYYGGNPFLQPTFSYNVEATYTYKSNVTATLEYSVANNVINETNEQRGTIYYSRPGNFAKQISYGISLSGNKKITKWWTFQYYTTYSNSKFKSTVYGQNLNDSKWYWVAAPTNQFVLSKLWSAELSGSYQTKILSGQFIVYPIGNVRVGVAKQLLQTKGTLKLNVSDVFYTNQIKGDIRNLANANANWFSYLDSRVVTVSFSYRFSKGQNLRLRQTGGSEVEQKRAKG